MARKPLTPEQRDQAANTRLLRTYGITLHDYNSLLAAQGGKCAICRKPMGETRLHTDHCHRFAKQYKVAAHKVDTGSGKMWFAFTQHRSGSNILASFYAEAMLRSHSEAIRKVKQFIKARTVRGLLCMHCNRGLRYFFDRPDNFERAAAYLRSFEGR